MLVLRYQSSSHHWLPKASLATTLFRHDLVVTMRTQNKTGEGSKVPALTVIDISVHESNAWKLPVALVGLGAFTYCYDTLRLSWERVSRTMNSRTPWFCVNNSNYALGIPYASRILDVQRLIDVSICQRSTVQVYNIISRLVQMSGCICSSRLVFIAIELTWTLLSPQGKRENSPQPKGKREVTWSEHWDPVSTSLQHCAHARYETRQFSGWTHPSNLRL